MGGGGDEAAHLNRLEDRTVHSQTDASLDTKRERELSQEIEMEVWCDVYAPHNVCVCAVCVLFPPFQARGPQRPFALSVWNSLSFRARPRLPFSTPSNPVQLPIRQTHDTNADRTTHAHAHDTHAHTRTRSHCMNGEMYMMVTGRPIGPS
jgi:hypothetical protein